MGRIALLVLVACHRSAAPSVEVRIDRGIELAEIIAHVAGAPGYAQPAQTAYLADVDRTFGQLHVTSPSYEVPIDRAIHGQLPDAPPGFADFFAAHRAYYAAVEERVRDAVARENPVPWFDAFFGARPGARYIVAPGLLTGPHNFGVHTDTELYQVLGVERADAAGLPILTDESMRLLVHEMAHSYVNPLLAAHRAELEGPAQQLFALVADRMRAQAYPTWDIALNEMVVRAVTVAYTRERKPALAAMAQRDELRRGFLWTRELADLLASRHHMDVAAIRELLPLLVARGVPDLPFMGPIDAALHDPAMLLPADPALAAYVREIHDRFFPGAPLAATLPPRGNAIAYGTIDHTGLVVAADHVEIAGKRIAGEHLVVIAAWPRDVDRAHGIAIYSAASPADLIGINSVRHGPTDWLVAHKIPTGFEVIDSGDFP